MTLNNEHHVTLGNVWPPQDCFFKRKNALKSLFIYIYIFFKTTTGDELILSLPIREIKPDGKERE